MLVNEKREKIIVREKAFKKVVADLKDIAIINQFTLEDHKIEDIQVYTLKLANDRVDRDGERFHEGVLDSFNRSIVGKSFLLGHKHDNPGVGRFFKSELIQSEDQQKYRMLWLMASLYMLKDGNENLIKNINAGIAWAVSISFFCPSLEQVKNDKGEHMFWEWQDFPEKKAEAVEGSLVWLGAQYDAIITKSMKRAERTVEEMNFIKYSLGVIPSKAVVGFQNLPLADEATAWGFSANDGDIILGDPPDWKKYKKAHVWVDSDNQENKAGYKLPIAKMINGQLRVVWRGVAAAMAALLGARGGVDIPDADRRGVYNHLVKYYEKFKKEAPEFKGFLDEIDFKEGELVILDEELGFESLRAKRIDFVSLEKALEAIKLDFSEVEKQLTEREKELCQELYLNLQQKLSIDTFRKSVIPENKEIFIDEVTKQIISKIYQKLQTSLSEVTEGLSQVV